MYYNAGKVRFYTVGLDATATEGFKLLKVDQIWWQWGWVRLRWSQIWRQTGQADHNIKCKLKVSAKRLTSESGSRYRKEEAIQAKSEKEAKPG